MRSQGYNLTPFSILTGISYWGWRQITAAHWPPILALAICPEGFHIGWYWRILRDQGEQNWMHHAYPGFTKSHQEAQPMLSQYWTLSWTGMDPNYPFPPNPSATDFWPPSQQLFSQKEDWRLNSNCPGWKGSMMASWDGNIPLPPSRLVRPVLPSKMITSLHGHNHK